MSKIRARKIKLLLFDVDGVLTDGKLFFVPGVSKRSVDPATRIGSIEANFAVSF